jgi:predicted esterase
VAGDLLNPANMRLLVLALTQVLAMPIAAQSPDAPSRESTTSRSSDPLASRYELGKRLRRFERTWEGLAPDSPEHAAAAAAMQGAVRRFFGLDLAGVGAELDRGMLAMLGVGTADDGTADLLALTPRPQARVLAPGDELVVVIDAPAGEEPVPGFELELNGLGGTHTQRVAEGAAWPLRIALRAPAAPGDYALRARFARGARSIGFPEQTISVVADAAARLAALDEALRTEPRGQPLERASLDGLLRILRPLLAGRSTETDFPAARLLAEAETLAAALATEQPVYDTRWFGETWLRVPLGRRTVIARVLVPPRAADQAGPRPIVLALHGMGGSENLFFDGYGDGAITRLCAARGWLLVAPRMLNAADAAALLELVAERFAGDRDAVFVVGHSMGAATAIAAAQRPGSRFRALAALGGGGSLERPAELAGLPVFVGVGSEDFALGAARSLARGLRRAGLERVELREYAGIEHMLIVQDALDDVFAFFAR